MRKVPLSLVFTTVTLALVDPASAQDTQTSSSAVQEAPTDEPPPPPMPQPVPPPSAEAPVEEAPVDNDAEGNPSALEEITVTAQKRPENQQKVPVSLTAVTGRKLSVLRSGGFDVRFLSARIPSLTVESSFGRTFPRFYIRGLGNTDFDLNASQPVSMILDDVVLENPIVKGFPLFDIDRVEVLRGPQGTLFGRNTPAGIIKFETKKPTFEPEGTARLTYGRFNFIGFEGAVSGPIVEDTLAARASFLYERRDNWVDNLLTPAENDLEGFDDMAARFQLLYTPNDRFKALLNFHAHNLDGSARVFRANIIEPGTEDFVDDFDRGQVQQDGNNSQKVTQLGFSLRMSHDFGPATVTAITGYENAQTLSRGDIDGGFGASFAGNFGPGFIPFPSESADGIPSLNQVTQEIRIATNQWNKVNFQLGGFLFYEDLDIESFSFDTLAGGVQNGFAFQNQQTFAWALFGSLTYDVMDNLRVSGGLRYSYDEKDFTARRDVSPIGGGAISGLTANPIAEFLSWDLSVTYGITDDVNVYAKAARGFRAPTVQGRILFGDTVSVADSEKIISVEGGFKTEWWDRRVRANIAGFFYQLDDQQLTAVGGTQNFNQLINADKSIGYGGELDIEFLPLSDLFITIGTSYNKTEIQDEDLAIAACGGGCTVTDPENPNAPGTVLIDGNPLPHAPEWIVNASIRYGMPVSPSGEIFILTDLAYRSRINFFLYESVEFTDASLLEIGARVGYMRYDRKLEIAGFIRNLNDNLSRTGGIDFNNLTGFVNEPMIFGVEARVGF